jgi:two-component system nitrate/nitrite response regulator NarL
MEELIEIVVAEDSHLWRKTIIKELEQYHIKTVGEAETGKELLIKLQQQLPHVVILDLEMPEMDGNEAFNLMKEKYPTLKVIILSQHDDISLMENYVQRGAAGFLSKQAISGDLKLLADGIRAVFHNRPFNFSNSSGHEILYTRRETQIIPLLCHGKTSKQIAEELGLAEKTVEGYRKKIYKKTKTKNALEFIRYGIKKGLEFLGK